MANSKIYLGSTNIGSFFQGADDISIYLGDEKVYPLGEPTLKWKATYQDSHVESAQCDSSSEIVNGEITLSNLVSVEIGDYCVTSIGMNAFFSCRSLTSVTIGSGVTDIGNMAFGFCDGLTSIVIPSGVTVIGYMAFRNCTSLTSIDIPDSVTGIGGNAFYGCTSLTSVTVNASTPPTFLTGGAFDDTNDCPIYVPCESLNAYKSASGWSTYANRIQAIQGSCPKLLATYQGGTTRKVECNGNTALTTGETKPSGYVASAMTDAVIGDCVRTIVIGAFQGCSGLTSIDIPDSVTLIDSSAFMYCFGLTSCTIGNSVTTINGNAFNSCSGLTNINIPNSVTIIGGEAFRSCSSLTSVTIPNSVTEISYSTFSNCTSLTSIVIPDSVTSIGSSAFWYCSSLTSITIEASVPPTLDTDVFYRTNNCPIYVPSQSVNTYKTTSGWSTYASRIQAIPNS